MVMAEVKMESVATAAAMVEAMAAVGPVAMVAVEMAAVERVALTAVAREEEWVVGVVEAAAAAVDRVAAQGTHGLQIRSCAR